MIAQLYCHKRSGPLTTGITEVGSCLESTQVQIIQGCRVWAGLWEKWVGITAPEAGIRDLVLRHSLPRNRSRHDRQESLVLIPLFVLDFVCIHPFRDGPRHEIV